MVKKILFLLTFLFITLLFNLDVNAIPLGYPETWAYFDDGSHLGPDSSTIYNWWGQQYYKSPYLIGGVSSAQYINRLDFNWPTANLCPNQDISIEGYIGALYNFFTDQSYTLVAYNNSIPLTCSTSVDTDGSRLKFKCYGKGGGALNFFLFQNSYSLVKQYDVGISREMTISCDVTNQEIVNQSITNTQNIINNQTNNSNAIIGAVGGSTSNIINNQNQNTQDIINNQNSNTDKEIESQEVCKTTIIDNKNIVTSSSMLNSSGQVEDAPGWGITDYLKFDGSVKKINSTGNAPSLCFYNNNKELISCYQNANVPIGDVNVPANSVYLRASIAIEGNRPQYEINYCKNGNQALSDDINSLNDTISSDTSPDTENQLNNLNNSMISDTPITDLITLPITLINSYITGFNGSCSPYNFGNLLGTDIIFPCINLDQRLGSNLWTIIDSLTSIFLIYNIAMLFITAFEGFTSLRDDYESLYQPKHADTGYQPKHGGGN